jgi:fatty acid desaturase
MVSHFPAGGSVTLTLGARRGSDFSVLRRQICEARLLDRCRVSYTFRIGLTLLAYVACWVAFGIIGNSWFQAITAVALGLIFTQVSFLGHDGGHQQVWRSKRANDMLGIFAGDLLTGLSYGWWVDKHNRHHAKPNHEGYDPDIGDGVLAFTTEQAANRNSSIARFLTRNQALLFFPLLTLEGLNLHAASVQSLIKGETHKRRGLEIFLFTIHVLAYFGAVLLVLDPVKALVFVSIHQAVFGVYMGCSFAPNHKGMPTIPEGECVDFLRRQVLTSRNVRGGRFTDFLLGGLNYQVEHHLVPNMPRPSLRHAQAMVRDFCAEHEIAYTETTLVGSYAAALKHLHDLGAPLRAKAAAV